MAQTITLRDQVSGDLIAVDPDQVTDEVARRLIRQDEVSQMVYAEERRSVSPIVAMNRAMSYSAKNAR